MLGNDLIEYQQMKRYQESLLSEAERIRFLDEARRASSSRRNELRLARSARLRITTEAARTPPGRILRSPVRILRAAAARVGSVLVLVGNYLEGLDGCQLGKG